MHGLQASLLASLLWVPIARVASFGKPSAELSFTLMALLLMLTVLVASSRLMGLRSGPALGSALAAVLFMLSIQVAIYCTIPPLVDHLGTAHIVPSLLGPCGGVLLVAIAGSWWLDTKRDNLVWTDPHLTGSATIDSPQGDDARSTLSHPSSH